MSQVSGVPFERVLDPMERISELLFGLIMALTFTCTFGVATAGNIRIQTSLIGALGCNLAWGIVDAGIYLLARINDRDARFPHCAQYARRRTLKLRNELSPKNYRR